MNPAFSPSHGAPAGRDVDDSRGCVWVEYCRFVTLWRTPRKYGRSMWRLICRGATDLSGVTGLQQQAHLMEQVVPVRE